MPRIAGAGPEDWPITNAELEPYYKKQEWELGVSGLAGASPDPTLKDAWGLPAVRVTYQDHPDDLKTMRFFLDRSLELLDAAVARKKWLFPVEEQDYSAHLLGTCRMGNNPSRSVIDKHHRAHDVPNLFIADGSSFVTSGRGQPTCTIQALAYRAADHIIRWARSA